jgi:hypothetical protein
MQEIKTITDLVWDYFIEHPEEELSTTKVFKALSIKYKKPKIRYNGVNAAIYRFYLQGKIFKTSRGIYVLKYPLAHGQLKIGDIESEEGDE